MRVCYLRGCLLCIITIVLWSRIYKVYGMDSLFSFNNMLPMYNILKGKHHVCMSDLKISESYLFKEPKNINIDLALLALKGMDRENRNMFDYKSKNNDDNNKNVERILWNKMNKDDFIYSKLEVDDKLIKGLPDILNINNIRHDIKRNMLTYLNNYRYDNENMEIIFKGENKIPYIYNNILFILLIFFMYLFCIRILYDGYRIGKLVAKDFIPKISTLFMFFVLLKSTLLLFPPVLCVLLCIFLTFYFYTISMNSCQDIYFLDFGKIKKEPIGWIFIVFSHSILLGNIIYHLLFRPSVFIYLHNLIENYFIEHILCVIILIVMSIFIFFLMISNIFPATKLQNFVFSFTSSYFLLSFCSYLYNLFVFLMYDKTKRFNIIQIEPYMFFSSTSIFSFNFPNSFILLCLFFMTCLPFIIPKHKLGKKKRGGKKMKQKKNDLKEPNYRPYDMIFNYFS
ncbi:hypothetical protein PFUGPA_02882 [Plasmodium falciparum Palo Alto/Uganda]|uniref:Uncharacterized protein n=2 Tax=Plasmodium falciparum TaxID=5833 RepID=W4IYK5_PLAFP|nr:hypothetical protein PFUGPA_02882 [Plasmodium falciparum Palo Alto/Uganda]ETW61722.1 hypothetical protein PFMC_02374 [Plasmodium falciparum CAMP/Malaysia]